jgi:hypothetical protein
MHGKGYTRRLRCIKAQFGWKTRCVIEEEDEGYH